MKKIAVLLIILCNLTICSFAQDVMVIYGYLYVYPYEIGNFSSYPSNVISSINSQKNYGINTWRIPTMEELELLVAQNIIASTSSYMTKSNSSGRVILVTTKNEQEKANIPLDYVDLGLPSGILWKTKNESGVYYSYEQAMDEYGDELPTKTELIELKNKCEWYWNGDGYKVVGPNGNYINMNLAGIRDCNGHYNGWGEAGFYWSSTRNSADEVWMLIFYNAYKIVVGNEKVDCSGMGLSVRLVKRP